MSSAFQLSSAYRPYRPPLSDVSTMAAGIATRTAATSSFPAQPWANEAVSRTSSVRRGRRRTRVWNAASSSTPSSTTPTNPSPSREPDTSQTATRPIPATTSTMRRRPTGAARPDGGGWSDESGRGRVGEKVLGGGHQLHLCA